MDEAATAKSMFSCPQCNADRSRILPVDPCPACGAMLKGATPLTPDPDGELPTVAMDKKSPRARSESPLDVLAKARADSIDESFDPEATVAEPSAVSQDALARIFPSSMPTLDGIHQSKKGPELKPVASPFAEISSDDPDGQMATTTAPPVSAPPPARASSSSAPAAPALASDLPAPVAEAKVPSLSAKLSVPPPTPAAAKSRVEPGDADHVADKKPTVSKESSDEDENSSALPGVPALTPAPAEVAQSVEAAPTAPPPPPPSPLPGLPPASAAPSEAPTTATSAPVNESPSDLPSAEASALPPAPAGPVTAAKRPPKLSGAPPIPGSLAKQSAPMAAELPAPPGPAGFPVTHTPSPFEATLGGDSGVFTKTVADEAVKIPVPASLGPASPGPASPGPASPGPASPGPLFDRAQSPDVFTRTVADAQALLPPSKGGPALPRMTPAPGRPSDMLPRPPSTPTPPSAAAVPPSIAVMPSAYAMPGQSASFPQQPDYTQSPAGNGYQPSEQPPAFGNGYPPAGYRHTPPPPGGYLHTPPPPGGYGPPPDANDASYPMAALDSLTGDDGRPETPNAVWRQAHPSATRWAAKRTARPAITPRPGIIALGLMLAGLGAYLLLIFLPSKAPLTAAAKAEQMQQAGVDVNAWHFTSKLMTVASINAGLFVLLGIVVLLQGALHRQGPARRKSMSKTSLLLLSCFGLLAVSFVALLLAASMR